MKAKFWKLLGLLFTLIFVLPAMILAMSAIHAFHAAGVAATINGFISPFSEAYDSARGRYS
jgi:ABC-type Fe3+ transport system permease subunit